MPWQLLPSGGCWKSFMFLGHSSPIPISAFLVRWPSSLCLPSLCPNFPLIRIAVIGCMTCPKPAWPHLNWIISAKMLLSNNSICRLWVVINLGRRDTIKPSTTMKEMIDQRMKRQNTNWEKTLAIYKMDNIYIKILYIRHEQLICASKEHKYPNKK